MKLAAKLLQVMAALLAFAAVGAAEDGGHGPNLSRPIMLVATPRLAGSAYEQTVVVAAPLPQGGHIGFIINRPTDVRLDALFPDQAACHQVDDPVYAGGPALSNAVFALTRKAPGGTGETGSAIPITPGLFAVLDGADVDRVIETTPKSARFFLGAIVWAPAELEKEIQSGAWNVRATNAEVVFRPDSADLWDDLQAAPPAPEWKLTWT